MQRERDCRLICARSREFPLPEMLRPYLRKPIRRKVSALESEPESYAGLTRSRPQ